MGARGYGLGLTKSKPFPNLAVQPIHAWIVASVTDNHRLPHATFAPRCDHSSIHTKRGRPEGLSRVRAVVTQRKLVGNGQPKCVAPPCMPNPLDVDGGNLPISSRPSPGEQNDTASYRSPNTFHPPGSCGHALTAFYAPPYDTTVHTHRPAQNVPRGTLVQMCVMFHVERHANLPPPRLHLRQQLLDFVLFLQGRQSVFHIVRRQLRVGLRRGFAVRNFALHAIEGRRA